MAPSHKLLGHSTFAKVASLTSPLAKASNETSRPHLVPCAWLGLGTRAPEVEARTQIWMRRKESWCTLRQRED
eukprot:6155746-Pyramimonas_sp.AAC.1